GYLIADCKYDGVRGNIVVDNVAEAAWLSRVSKFIPALEHLNGFDKRWQQLLNDDRCIFPDGFMLDGELMVKGVDLNTGSGPLRTKWVKRDNRGFQLASV
ncbi:ATP-dependent DNA ligase, partial [Xylella fastidiosa subsp. multiplex]|nr:ATP-dependent DNA ligase [Xylella fastidiosa subsp. multiplex]